MRYADQFDFLDLDVFLAVFDTSSFHAAGQRMNMSQSSVTRRVQRLEDALGTPLFERTTRMVRPTLAAKRLRVRAEAMITDAEETTRALRDETAAFAYQRAQTVTVATIPTAITGLVAPALRAVGLQGRVRLLDLAANEVAEAVAQGDADFGVCSIPMLEPVTAFQRLFDDPLVLAVPAGHVWAQAKAVRWADLAEAPLILSARGTGNRLLIDEALARSGQPLRWRYEVGRTTTALDLVAAGVGVAPVPRMAAGTAEQPYGIHTVAISDPDVVRPIGIVSRIGQSDTQAAAALKAALAAVHA